MALSYQSVAPELDDIMIEKFLRSVVISNCKLMDSSLKKTDYGEDDENHYYAEGDGNHYFAAISHPQSRAYPFRIEFVSQWRKKLIGRRTRAEEELHEDAVNWNLKNSRNRSSHEASVKESSFEIFDVLRRMVREMVSNSYYAQDEKIRRASINPISDFQDQADTSKELIGREAHVSRSWSDWQSRSPCETNRPTQPRVHVNTELLELELDKRLAVRWKNSIEWSDTVSKLLAHYNGRPDQDQKPYNMFGTTALRSQPQWGDNGGEKHVLQVGHHSHDYSVISPNSVPLASPPSSNASSEEGDGDKRPPPDRSPPYGVASSPAEGQLCFRSLAMICLFLGAEVCVAAPLIRYNTGASLSEDAKTLLFVAKLFGFAGFLLCFGACIVQRSRRASRLMTAMGCAAAVCGFLSILGLLFPDNLMIWLIGALCLLPISAIPFAFKRSV